VHRRQRLRHAEVVVERAAKSSHDAAPGRRLDALRRLGGVAHERLDPAVRRLGVGDRLRRPLERRAVVAGAERVAQHLRPDGLQHVLDERAVAQALAHLLAAAAGHGDQAVVEPVLREAVAGAGRLRQLVLVVREDEVDPAGVHVEGLAEVVHGHGGALDVPPRPARAPRRRPRRLAGLGRLPAARSRAGRASRPVWPWATALSRRAAVRVLPDRAPYPSTVRTTR
jgi:hypothetical protein